MDEEIPAVGAKSTARTLVGCGVGKTNHLVNRAGIQPVAVIDHHSAATSKVEVLFSDIRLDAAASASIAANYLREQNIVPGKELLAEIENAPLDPEYYAL